MEDVMYHDYASWVIEKSELFNELTKHNSLLLERYKYAKEVVKHLYDNKLDIKTLTEDEEAIFSFGFYYLFEEFEQITTILNETYNGDIQRFNANIDGIILYLNAVEFENEIYNAFPDLEKTKPIVDLELEILTLIEKDEKISKELYAKFDEVSTKVFSDLKLDFYPINEIFFDIADEMGLV